MHSHNYSTNENKPGRQAACCELDWLAFQYIANELTDSERSGFEDRMATDQDAREAVARAVHLCRVTAIALRPDRVQLAAAKSSWSRGRSWAVCGTAAAVILSIVLVTRLPMRDAVNPEKTAEGLNATSEVQDLAMMWATARKDLSAELSDVNDDLVSQAVTAIEEREGIETPSWMLIAVAGSVRNGESPVE